MKCKCGSHWVSVCPNCHEYMQTWKWISIEDRLPDLNSFVLSTDGELVAATVFLYNDHIKKYHWDYFSSGCGCCDTDMKNVTHWMPLPIPPLEKT